MLRIEALIERKGQPRQRSAPWDVEEQRLYWINSYGPSDHRWDAGEAMQGAK